MRKVRGRENGGENLLCLEMSYHPFRGSLKTPPYVDYEEICDRASFLRAVFESMRTDS